MAPQRVKLKKNKGQVVRCLKTSKMWPCSFQHLLAMTLEQAIRKCSQQSDRMGKNHMAQQRRINTSLPEQPRVICVKGATVFWLTSSWPLPITTFTTMILSLQYGWNTFEKLPETWPGANADEKDGTILSTRSDLSRSASSFSSLHRWPWRKSLMGRIGPLVQ